VDIPNLALGPLERRRPLVVGCDESVNGLPDLLRGSEADPAQGPAAQDAEPALDLIEPTGVRRGKVKMHVAVCRRNQKPRVELTLKL
jgi:hypothetical protein